jgi:hypothetical protein
MTNPFLIFGVIAMAVAALFMRDEPPARALAFVGFLFTAFGVAITIGTP